MSSVSTILGACDPFPAPGGPKRMRIVRSDSDAAAATTLLRDAAAEVEVEADRDACFDFFHRAAAVIPTHADAAAARGTKPDLPFFVFCRDFAEA